MKKLVHNRMNWRSLCYLLVVAVVSGGFIITGNRAAVAESKYEKIPQSGETEKLFEALKRRKDTELSNLAFPLPDKSLYLKNQKVKAPGGANNDSMGWTVSISGDTAVLGAPYDDLAAFDDDRGSAYVFIRDGEDWAFQEKLTLTTQRDNDKFGWSVDIDGNTIVVGTPFHRDGSQQPDGGRVFIFTRSGTDWTESGTVLAPTTDGFGGDSTAGDHFGVSVAIDGGTVVIGAQSDTVISGGASEGSAYVYSTGGGSPVKIKWDGVVATPGNNFKGNFGIAVDIYGSSIIVGADSYSESGVSSNQGAAFTFTTSGTLNSMFTAGGGGAHFGSSVALDNGNVVVGAPGVPISMSVSGKAYIIPSGGSTPTELAVSGSIDGTGRSVAINGDTILVGASNDSTKGEAYVFRNVSSSWSYQATIKMNESTPSGPDRFGQSVAIDGTNIVVGSWSDTDTGAVGGTATFFVIASPRPYNFDSIPASNISIARPGSPMSWFWYIPDEDFSSANWGTTGDVPVPADFDGDGITDLAIFKPSTGYWWILYSSDSTYDSVPFGTNGDKPRPNDFDGDGKADLGLFRPSDLTWYWVRSSDSDADGVQFGSTGDIPLMGDYNGDGNGDPATFTPSTGTWKWYNMANQQTTSKSFGTSGDIPATGDFDADLKSDFSLFRPSDGTWYRLNSSETADMDEGFYAIQFGQSGDIPAVLDYDADGESDISVFRPSNGTWYIINSGYPTATGSQYAFVQFGQSGDVPAPSAYQQ